MLVPAALRLNIDELRESAAIKPCFEEDAGAKVGGREEKSARGGEFVHAVPSLPT